MAKYDSRERKNGTMTTQERCDKAIKKMIAAARRKNLIFRDVQRLMEARDEARRQQKHYAASVAWFTKKLEALQAGAFEFDTITGVFTFQDGDLNRANY